MARAPVQAKVIIGGDSSGGRRALTAFDDKVKGTARTVRGFLRDFKLIGGTIALGIGINAVRSALSFNDAMLRLQRTYQLNQEGSDRLKGSIGDLATKSRHGPEAIAVALDRMAVNGRSAEENMEALAKVATHAGFREEDLAEVSEDLAKAMLNLNIPLSAVDGLLRDLSVGARLGHMDVGVLVSNLEDVSEPAKNAGVDVGSLISVLAALGEDGATKVKPLLEKMAELNDGSAEAKKLFGELGVTFQETADGGGIDLVDVIGDLRAALVLGKEDAAAFIKALGIPESLLQDIQKVVDGYGEIKRISDDTPKVDPATEAAGPQTDEAAKKTLTDYLKGVGSALNIGIGDAITETLTLPGKLSGSQRDAFVENRARRNAGPLAGATGAKNLKLAAHGAIDEQTLRRAGESAATTVQNRQQIERLLSTGGGGVSVESLHVSLPGVRNGNDFVRDLGRALELHSQVTGKKKR